MIHDTYIYHAAAVCDAAGTFARPGSIAVRAGQITASGTPKLVVAQTEHAKLVINLPRTVILPLFVNAHAHLDLTSVGTKGYIGNFTSWLRWVIHNAPIHRAQTIQSVQLGISMSREAAVGVLGDIARSNDAIHARHATNDLPGISYLECFGNGTGQALAAERLAQTITQIEKKQVFSHDQLRLGVQPHSPYSAGLDLYQQAASLAKPNRYPLCTHLAETPQELRFVRDGDGPLAELLRDLGKWDSTIQGTGLHPVDWLKPMLKQGRWLLAHCNYLDDPHIQTLYDCGASVAYCPVASDYFGHHQPQRGMIHRYRDLLQVGVNVCLGTDSIICQPANEPQPLGILPQMRHLFHRDGTDPMCLLEMATVNGMRAMGLNPNHATLKPGAPAGLAAVTIDPDDPTDPLRQVLLNQHLATPLTTHHRPCSDATN